MTLAILTSFTLVAFAANSLLCRMALGGHLIDPISFTTVRLVSGALALIPISQLFGEIEPPRKMKGSWGSAFALFAYAAAFSLAYTSLSTGTGALVLFGAVQVTMIGGALKSGEKIRPAQWVGTAIAICGLIYLVLPGITAPNPVGALLMCIAGIAAGIYSIRGKNVLAPLAMTSGNFVRSTPMAILLSSVAYSLVHLQPLGILFALISGTVTSGIGYALWYHALRGLTITQASVLQLLVPALAAFGGVTFLSEEVTMRLIASSILIIGGVAVAVVSAGPK